MVLLRKGPAHERAFHAWLAMHQCRPVKQSTDVAETQVRHLAGQQAHPDIPMELGVIDGRYRRETKPAIEDKCHTFHVILHSPKQV